MSSSSTAQHDAHSLATEVVVVDTNQPAGWFDLHELWRYRDLIWIFAHRDITVRYRQTLVGIAWTVLQPLALMCAFGVFKRMLVPSTVDGYIPDEVKSNGPIMTLSGLILYQMFSGIISTSTLCLVDNRQMLTKVYFPRIVLPLAASLRPILDFGIGLITLLLMMCWFQIPIHAAILLAPLIVLATAIVGLAFGMWLSALNAHYRDFGHIVPFALQLGLIVCPIASTTLAIKAGIWRCLYFVNPMASLIECFRWSMIANADTFPGWLEISISTMSALALLFSGAWYFRRVDRFLADSI